jgi:hypothetical protein
MSLSAKKPAWGLILTACAESKNSLIDGYGRQQLFDGGVF